MATPKANTNNNATAPSQKPNPAAPNQANNNNNNNNNNNQRVITTQVKEDPLSAFRFENDWNASVFTCCEDCKLSKIIFQFDFFILKFIKFIYELNNLFS